MAESTSTRAQGLRHRLINDGWWVAVAAVAVCLLTLASLLSFRSAAPDRGLGPGDGSTVSSYGFELEPLHCDPSQIVASGMARDGLLVLDDPAALPADQVETLSRNQRGKLLVGSDRVVGVVVGDAARAYPLRFLRWHEAVNDTLDGRPILVSYSPLCDSVVVADRRIGSEVLSFGISGLVLSSNTLLYDRPRDGRRSSLWSQIQARAVAGPAAAADLELAALPSAVTTWADWRTSFPETTVLAPAEGHARQYRRDPYHSYFGSDILRFPVAPLPGSEPRGSLSAGLKDRVLVIETSTAAGTERPGDARAGKERRIVSLPDLARSVGADHGEASLKVAGHDLLIRFSTDPPTISLAPHHLSGEQQLPGLATRFAFWFAWYAQHPTAQVSAPISG